MNADRAQQERYMDCLRTLGERSGATRWVTTVHRAPVCVLISTPHRPLTTVLRLQSSQNAHRAFPQEVEGRSENVANF